MTSLKRVHAMSTAPYSPPPLETSPGDIWIQLLVTNAHSLFLTAHTRSKESLSIPRAMQEYFEPILSLFP